MFWGILLQNLSNKHFIFFISPCLAWNIVISHKSTILLFDLRYVERMFNILYLYCLFHAVLFALDRLNDYLIDIKTVLHHSVFVKIPKADSYSIDFNATSFLTSIYQVNKFCKKTTWITFIVAMPDCGIVNIWLLYR